MNFNEVNCSIKLKSSPGALLQSQSRARSSGQIVQISQLTSQQRAFLDHRRFYVFTLCVKSPSTTLLSIHFGQARPIFQQQSRRKESAAIMFPLVRPLFLSLKSTFVVEFLSRSKLDRITCVFSPLCFRLENLFCT